MMVGKGRPAVRYLLAALALSVAGCGASANLIGPENELEVANGTDNFEWQVSTLSSVTQTLTYTWVHTGELANVNQSSAMGGGTATLRITDDQGVEVYSRSLSQDGDFPTDVGDPGNWTVTVSLNDASGTLNFRIQAR